MSNLYDLPRVLAEGQRITSGHVADVTPDGDVAIHLAGTRAEVRCRMLQTCEAHASLRPGDEVLVWLGDEAAAGAVVLGRVGRHGISLQPVVPAADFAARPADLVIEAQGDLVLRNGQSRIRLSAAGDVEIVCNSFATRSRRLLRLLAPLIKLN